MVKGLRSGSGSGMMDLTITPAIKLQIGGKATTDDAKTAQAKEAKAGQENGWLALNEKYSILTT